MSSAVGPGPRRLLRLHMLVVVLVVPALAAAQSDFTGVWKVSAVAGAPPPLTADAARIYERRRAASAGADFSWDSATRCIPLGVPRILAARAPFEILQEPATITMLFQVQRLYRKIYLEPGAPVNDDATFMGQSFGHWDGDTLVIDTHNFKPDTSLDDSGVPHSEGLRLTERLRLVDAKTLADQIRIEDPRTLLRPWDIRIVFKRQENIRIQEDVCVDRMRASKR